MSIIGAWDKKELKILKRLWPSHDGHEVAERLDRSYASVKKMASRLGITKTKRYLRTLGRKV